MCQNSLILIDTIKNLVCFKVSPTNAKGRQDLLDLKPFTEYEFQISSKLHLSKGSWSDWSEPFRTQTPDEGMCFRKEGRRRERRDRRGISKVLVLNQQVNLRY